MKGRSPFIFIPQNRLCRFEERGTPRFLTDFLAVMRCITRKSAARKNEAFVFSEGGGFADALKARSIGLSFSVFSCIPGIRKAKKAKQPPAVYINHFNVAHSNVTI